MKKQLESLSKKELIDIAHECNLFKPENMDRQELIRSILNVNNIKYEENSKDKEIKAITTMGTRLYIGIFSFTILLLFVMTISQFFTKFYFSGKLTANVRNDVFGLVLSLGSLAWSLFIFHYWWKHKTFNLFMMLNIVISVGYFAYFMYHYYKNIDSWQAYRDNGTNNQDFKKNFDIYKAMFYTWLSITGFLTISIGTMLVVKAIRF